MAARFMFRQSIDSLPTHSGLACCIPYQRLHSATFADAKVGSQIDHAHSRVEQGRCLLHRHPVRGGEEDQIAALQVGRGWILEFQPQSAAQARKHLRDGVPASPRDVMAGTILHFRVLRQQAQQFDTGVAGAADDSDLIMRLPPR
jgi:hypothetical protein